MKYGETLQQRSIPEWENYNVDYNDLKRLIKVRTTRGQGEALSIPGHGNEAKALKAFEQEFYRELTDQHQRVDLFVQSKAGEISRRLLHLDKQVGQLQQRYAVLQPGKISVKRLERYSRAEAAAEKAGEDIKSLARFVGAQKLAFVKILKKYRKWTGSPTLDSRFRTKVLDQPAAFSKRDFGSLLNQYTEVLAAVRAPFEPVKDGSKEQKPSATRNGAARESSSGSQRLLTHQDLPAAHACGKGTNSPAAELHTAGQNRSNIELDTVLAMSPIGKSGGKASYWIHPDNLVELHVLLLQYTRLWKSNGSNTAPAINGSRQHHCKESTTGNGTSPADGRDDDAGLIICDDLEDFARRRSSAPISDSEGSAGCLLEKPAATVRYLPTGEAVLAVNTLWNNNLELRTLGAFQSVVMKRKAVRHLFNSGLSNCKVDQLLREENSQDGEELKAIREWLVSHKEVQPLVQLHHKRTRFVGLRNSDQGGMWATLDRDILMKATREGFFNGKEAVLAFSDSDDSGFARFPFAVLEVRFEGGFGRELLSVLDKTHLTERIRGFSVETHAVATLCKPQGMPPPYWLPALDQDLRKIPATVKTATSRLSNNKLSPSPASTAKNSISATSNGDRPTSSGFSGPAVESSATSVPGIVGSSSQEAFKKKRRPRKDRPIRQQMNGNGQRDQRYWNEYDDGDENSENEPFVIYVNPDQSTLLPSFSTISKVPSSLACQVRKVSKRAKLWLHLSDQSTSKTPDETASAEDDSDLEDSASDPLMSHHKQKDYSTFQHRRRIVHDHATRARGLLLTRCCIAFYAASFVLLIVAALLASSGRRKAHLEVDVGVITGVVFSLVFAIAAVGCAMGKRERVGPFQGICVFVALTVVCACSGILLGGVIDR
ncbi:MAG: hypothetical protein L6R38_008660 [Xanthoria sp. 2 TBL-2021]|nr:MAG: hypothetical protein L6R38_008660 [Xanthoria sp. 2 TBL-2021]